MGKEEVVLKKGFGLFLQQCRVLFWKNFLLSKRQRRATILQLVSSFFFIFLIFLADQSVKASERTTTGFKNLFNPQPTLVTPIPRCEDGMFIKSPCYDFAWSGSGSSISTIVSNIMSNNPSRAIPPEKVKGFNSPSEVDDWLLANSMRCPGVLHFEERSPGVIAYGVQTNSTSKIKRGKYENNNFKFQMPLQAAAEREITRFVTGDATIAWDVAFTEFAHPNIETSSTVGDYGPTFLLAAAMFGFVIQMSNLVGEKELKLRQAMAIMGLMDSAYWLTWLLWEALLVMISSVLLVLFGMMFQFYFFLNNSFAVLFFMFFLFQLNMTGFSFMLSTGISKASSATTFGFLFFLIGFMTQLVTTFGFPYGTSVSKGIQNIWSIFPPNLLSIGVQYLGDATATKQDEGISWSNRNKCSSADSDCALTMEAIYIWLLGTFSVWFLLALYFDNVLPDANGVRKSCFYFLSPSYWIGSSNSRKEGGGCCSCSTKSLSGMVEPSIPDDSDVAAEEDLVKEQKSSGIKDPMVAIQIQGLWKIFSGKRELGCCTCKVTPEYQAVKGIWYNVEKDKLFCLLGHNGAGKTTTINCLTGVIPTTHGDALIYGDSIRSSGGMASIRKYMGVCPQFDILWGPLSGREHLEIFGSIKGLKTSDSQSGAQELLSQAQLLDSANVRSGSYSGGMKRRLSVAIALIGDPKVVFLDEPTTGMDPVTRRHVWDIIENCKRGRAIVLTTHSMEEADILGDRIAIMARGKLRCIGTSIHLKTRFGEGYFVNISVRQEDGLGYSIESAAEEDMRRAHVKRFFQDQLNVTSKEENKAYITFLIPREKESQLAEFFALLQQKKGELGISDIQLSLTTLEEVFLNISRQAEIESSAAEGRFADLCLSTEGNTSINIKVPIGAQYVAVPETQSEATPNGLMVEVFWQQDESGRLCIAGHSEFRVAPSFNQESAYLSRGPSHKRFSGRSRSSGRNQEAVVIPGANS